MKISRILGMVIPCAFLAISSQAMGQVISLDFSTLGSVYQDSTGTLFNSSGAGRTDVTSLFESDAVVAAAYLNNAISIPGWNETINFSLADLSFESAVADSGINSVDANGRPNSSTIRFDMGNTMDFIDPTPTDNSEFAMTSHSATLGGGQVNVSQFGNAIPLGPADGLWDVLTVDVHEMEHSLGYSGGLARFLDLVGPTGTPGRQLLVPTSLSGLPSDFSIPIVPGSAHIDGIVDNGLFNDTVVAEPGFNIGQRALPSDVEILSLGVIEGATSSEIHLSGTTAVPEPGTLALMLGVLPVALVARRRKNARQAA